MCQFYFNPKSITRLRNSGAQSARSDVDAEVGRDLELVDDIESGNVGQIPPDLPNREQIRREREKDRKQSYLDQYFSGGSKGTVLVLHKRSRSGRRLLFVP